MKRIPPCEPASFLWRPRLAQALAMGLSGRLILIVAPCGYGKTSLLASLASRWERFAGASRTRQLAWYQVTEVDNDPAIFVEGLLGSVGQVIPGFGELTRAVLRSIPDVRRSMERVMGVLLGELKQATRGRLALVLDDFHHLTDKTVIDLLERSLHESESPLCLILSSQLVPRFYLSPLRTRGWVLELGTDDLRFTAEEIESLALRVVGSRPSQGIIGDLVRWTDGWPSAVNLALLLLSRGRASLPLTRYVATTHGYALLVKELLSDLPVEQRELVLRSSVLRSLDAASLGNGLGVSDPSGFLQLVVEKALPVLKLAGSETSVCYEPMFRSALEQVLKEELLPHEYRALLVKVASYYAAIGEWDEAVHRYLRADAPDDAASVVEAAGETELLLGHHDTVFRWIRSLPVCSRHTHPRLMVREARLLLERGQVDEARALLVAARSHLETMRDEKGLADRLTAWSMMRLLEGWHAEARQAALNALQRLPPEDDLGRADVLHLLATIEEMTGNLITAFSFGARCLLAAERGGHWALAVEATLQLERLAHLRGRFSQSMALGGRAVQRSALLGSHLATLCSAGGVAALIHLERDQLQEASRIANRVLEASRRLRDTAAQVWAHLVLAAVEERIGQVRTSGQRLQEASALVSRLPADASERVLMQQMAASSLLRQGRRADALEKARAALRCAADCRHSALVDQCRVVLSTAEMSGLKMPLVLVKIRRLCRDLQGSGSLRWLAAGALLLAEGYRRLGLCWQARSALARSLALAQDEGYVGMPLGLPVGWRRLLVLAVRQGVAVDTAATLLGAERDRAAELLDALLADKKPQVRARAERAAKGLEAGTGLAGLGRLPWPGLVDNLPDTSEAPQVMLRTLGVFQAMVGGQPVEWPSIDVRNLVAYLMVHQGQALPGDRVLRDLWPKEDEADANVRLQVALYQAREALGPGYPPTNGLEEVRGSYLWEGKGCLIDASLFLELVDKARLLTDSESRPILSDAAVSLLEEAVALYGGEFLASIDFDWCFPLREELRLRLLWATRLLIDHHMAQASWDAAVRSGLKSLRANPLQEDVVRDLMVCYARMGDRNAVLQQYRELKRLLAKQLGAWPSDETRRLRVKLLGR